MKRLIALLLLCVLAFPVIAEAKWPERPVKFVLGSQPGTSIDIVGRILAKHLSDKFGQPFVPTNISSGGLGAFAMTMKNARPDGYSMGMGIDMNFSFGVLDKNASYTLKDFIFLASVFYGDSAVIASTKKGWKDIKEALTWAKDNNQKLDYLFQTPLDRMWMTLYAKEYGVELNLIPSTGPAAIITSIIGGHADLGYSMGIQYEQERAGNVKSLVVLTEERAATYPNAPTTKEVFEKTYGYVANRIIVLPKNTPDEAKEALGVALKEIITDPEFVAQLAKLQFIADYMPEDVITEVVESQLDENKLVMELTATK